MLAGSINPYNWVVSINEAVEFVQQQEEEEEEEEVEEEAQKARGEVAEAEADYQKEVVVYYYYYYSVPLKNQQYPTLQNHSNQSLQVVSTLINYLNH